MFARLILLLGCLGISKVDGISSTPVFDANSIKRLKTDIDSRISIEASPETLPSSGSWITVTWKGVMDPTTKDFIAAYAPADAAPETRAPVKYQLASIDPDHMETGNGKIQLRLLDIRGDYWFAFFRGNVTNPILAAISEGTVSIGSPAAPHQLHLALTSDPTEMRITWKSSSEVHLPQVQYSKILTTNRQRSRRKGRRMRRRLQEGEGEGKEEEEEEDDGDEGEKIVGKTTAASAVGLEEVSSSSSAPSLIAVEQAAAVSSISSSSATTSSSSTTSASADPPVANNKVEAAMTRTFTVEDVCGEPATTVGWTEPGYIHTAIMKGLEPSTTYSYKVGDVDSGLWSRPQIFKTPPAPRNYMQKATEEEEEGSVRLSLFADMSSAEIDGSLQPGYFSNDYASLNTSRALIRQARAGDIDLAFCVGDLSYASGYVARWDAWMDQIEPISRSVPFMTAPGNHERGDPSYSQFHPKNSFYPRNDGGGECGVPYDLYFPMPSTAVEKGEEKEEEGATVDEPWYSYEWGPLHFTVISTEHDFRKGSIQYEWIVKDLLKVDRSVTPWLIFVGHRPFYLSSTDDAEPDNPLSPSEQGSARLLREHLEPLLIQHKVDLVLSGHHHSYQRTCKLFEGKCITEADYKGKDYKAPVYVILGMAGRRMSTNFLQPPPAYFESLHGDAYGPTTLDADSSRLSLTFTNVATDSTVDQITLHLPTEHLLIRKKPAYRPRPPPLTSFQIFKLWACRLMITVLLCALLVTVYRQSYYFAANTSLSFPFCLARWFRGSGYKPIREIGRQWQQQGNSSGQSPYPMMNEMTPLMPAGGGLEGVKQHIRYRSGSALPVSSSTMIPENNV